MLKNINAVREVAVAGYRKVAVAGHREEEVVGYREVVVADHREEEVGYQEVEVDEEGLGSALHGIWM
jgi:hypothetical protein